MRNKFNRTDHRLPLLLSAQHLPETAFFQNLTFLKHTLVKFQLVRQIQDVYVGACVLAGKLFCFIFHRIPKLFMVIILLRLIVFQSPSEGSLIIKFYNVFIVLFRRLATKTIRQSTDGRMSYDK